MTGFVPFVGSIRNSFRNFLVKSQSNCYVSVLARQRFLLVMENGKINEMRPVPDHSFILRLDGTSTVGHVTDKSQVVVSVAELRLLKVGSRKSLDRAAVVFRQLAERSGGD